MTSPGLESKDFVEQAAEVIRQHRLRLPALIALEVCRPIAFLGGQFLWVLQPTLGVFAPRAVIGGLARTLEDPEAIDSLIARLEIDEAPEGREATWT